MQQQSYRTERFNQLILREVINILRTLVRDPRLNSLEIIEVITAKDLSSAKVFFTCEPDELSEVQHSLTKASGFIRYELAHRVQLRHTPHLNFKYDDTPQKAQAIENALYKLKQ